MPEKFTLTPEQVANLEEVWGKKTQATEELKSLLEREGREKRAELTGFETELINQEEEAWREVLGVNIDVPKLPAEITPEVRQKLESEGFSLVWLPDLDLLPDQLERQSPEDYLEELTKKYPNWRPYESLTDSEKNDPKVCRNLEEWFWEKVKDESCKFPNLPGRWLAVETLAKPAYGDKYQKTGFSKRLAFDDRFSVSWDDAKGAIDKAESRFLPDIGLPRGNLRFLEVLEWNLLGNRFDWGATNTYEWTNTEARGAGESRRLIVGRSAYGGAAYVHWYPPGRADARVGFRVAVEIGS